ncbi:MAG TPA: tachylectin-related carbohydrate-binding protein, partial [Burkholderiales bacterium]|nr:tachylectin-related carbohydrate-binding protein [Burkholderiales bacterium]
NSLWHWTNVRVRGNPQSHNVSTTTEEVDSLNVALPLYLQSIAVLAAAIDATGVHPEHKRTDPHLVYLGLGGDRFRGWSIRPIKGLKTLRDRANDLSCAAIAPAKSAANGMCDIPVRCTSPVTAVSQTVQFPPRSYDGVCNLLDNYDRPRDISTYYDNLIAEARFNIASVQMLVSKAGHALERAGTPPQVFKMEFYDADWLFAVDGEGRLFKFRHLMVTRPHKGGEKPKSGPRMVAATARLKTVGDSTRLIGNSAVHSESVPSVSMKVMPGADARVRNLRIHANLTRLAGDSHELSRAKLESGDWGNFVAVIVSEWFGDDLAVYGLKANGDLMWRDIGGAALGTVTSVKWLAAPADPVKEATQRVGNGWNSLKHVFSTGEGVVYGVASNGDLVWYRHKNNQDGNAPPQWEHHPVGVGWGGFTRLFSTGKGIIYAMKPDGTLVWYKHDGYLAGTGMSQPGAWEGPKTVGSGWQGFRQIFAADNGHIYAVNAAGELLYYNHKGWKTGAADWDAPVKLAAGWGDYTDVFAAMGADSRGAVIR